MQLKNSKKRGKRNLQVMVCEESTIIDLRQNEGGADLVDLGGKVHQLPCSIKYDGPSSVSHYFKPKSTGKLHQLSSLLLCYSKIFCHLCSLLNVRD
jgi:hypothetical protein